MLKLTHKLLCLILLGVVSTASWAQAKWYSVEYIVFEHAATGSSQEPGRRATDSSSNGAVRLLPSDGGNWASFRRLRADEMSLYGAQRSLGSSTRYTPRLHQGWLQQLGAGDQPQPVRVSTGAANTPITGTMTFRRGRFLHIDVDLTLVENPAYGGTTNFQSTNETRFHLQQTRRIRTQQLHYFDHPRFGVLVKVMPLAPPVQTSADETNASPEKADGDQTPAAPNNTDIPLPPAETPTATEE